jgi:hypothetical protein
VTAPAQAHPWRHRRRTWCGRRPAPHLGAARPRRARCLSPRQLRAHAFRPPPLPRRRAAFFKGMVNTGVDTQPGGSSWGAPSRGRGRRGMVEAAAHGPAAGLALQCWCGRGGGPRPNGGLCTLPRAADRPGRRGGGMREGSTADQTQGKGGGRARAAAGPGAGAAWAARCGRRAAPGKGPCARMAAHGRTPACGRAHAGARVLAHAWARPHGRRAALTRCSCPS